MGAKCSKRRSRPPPPTNSGMNKNCTPPGGAQGQEVGEVLLPLLLQLLLFVVRQAEATKVAIEQTETAWAKEALQKSQARSA